MSLKDNIDMVKEELNSEEKFFEKAVVTEKFVKKYKKPLIGSVIAIVLIVAADIAYDLNKQSTIAAANMSLSALQADGSDKAAASQLASLSPELYELWSYSQAISKKSVDELKKVADSKNETLEDLASYEAAQMQGDTKLLTKYAKQEDAIYKDLALVELGVLAIQAGKIDEAHTNLAMVSEQSPLYNVAKSLMHYGVK